MRPANLCRDCDNCIRTTEPDKYGEVRPIKEAQKWTCFMAPREAIQGVVDESYILPNPYELCWKVRMIFPRHCPLHRPRIPGQKSLNLGD